MRQTVRFGQLAREGQRLLDPIYSLIRQAKKPKCQGGKAQHSDSGIEGVEECIIYMSLALIERAGFLVVLHCQTKLPEMHKGDLHRQVTSHPEARIRETVSQMQKFLGDLACCRQLCPQGMECPKSPKDFRNVGCVT